MELSYIDIHEVLSGKTKTLKQLAIEDYDNLKNGKPRIQHSEIFFRRLDLIESWLIKENYLQEDGTITKKGEAFCYLYERKVLWVIPLGKWEYFAKDYPFVAGALVLVIAALSAELVKFLFNLLSCF